MKPERSSLYDMFYRTLSPLYSPEVTERLAEAHCEAHEQFLREMYLDKSRASRSLKGGKPTGKLRRNRSGLMQAARKVIGKSKVIPQRAKPVNFDDVKREVLNYLGSVSNPVPLTTIFDILRSSYEWSFSQVKRAVRELREAKKVEQIGSKKLARYRLPAPFVEMAPAGPEVQA